MFIAVLFVIAPNWQQTKCPSTDEWEKQVLSIYIMNCFSGKKKKKWFSDNTIWINLKNNYVDTNNKCWRGSGEERTLLYYWSGCKLMQPLWKTIWSCLRKLKVELPHDPAIPFLGIYLDKTLIQKDRCTLIFIATLFTIVKTWEQPKCPSTDEWIKMIWYVYCCLLFSH